MNFIRVRCRALNSMQWQHLLRRDTLSVTLSGLSMITGDAVKDMQDVSRIKA